MRPPPNSTLFPYAKPFRSSSAFLPAHRASDAEIVAHTKALREYIRIWAKRSKGLPLYFMLRRLRRKFRASCGGKEGDKHGVREGWLHRF